MAIFLKVPSPPILTSKTYIRHLSKVINKPMYSVTYLVKQPYSSYSLAITKSYNNAPQASIRGESIPEHVALLMDSHKDSITKEKDLNLHHKLGYGALMDIFQICIELGIKVLSIYMISENSHRPKEFEIAMNIMKSDLEELSRNDIKVSIIGNRNAIPDSVQESITRVEETTKNNKSLHIIEAIDYSGRYDIIQACITLAEKVEQGLIQPEDIDESVIQQELGTNCSKFPNPDLIIRTGGKYSVGNFMLWQSAYSEIYFVDKDALHFNKTDFIEALEVYQKRTRRFGGSEIKKGVVCNRFEL